MYVRTNSKKYTEISNVSFAPQVDLMGDNLPYNELYVDIYTEDDIDVARRITLYDANNTVFASYWIIETQRITPKLLRIKAESILSRLDRKSLKAKMYGANNETAYSEISTLLDYLNVDYTIDSSLQNVALSGYCPKQTARERLQWICFICGAIVRDFFSTGLEVIVPSQKNVTAIPSYKVYMRPEVSLIHYITKVNLTYYSFTEGTPQSGDESIKVDGKTYIVTEDDMSLANPDLPASPRRIPTSEMSFDGIYLVNSSNVSGILTRLATHYFKNEQCNADIINDAEYTLGDKVSVPLTMNDIEGDGETVEGYIDSLGFSFGRHAKSRVHFVVQAHERIIKLIVRYLYGTTRLGKQSYHFPEGYVYTIPNPYIDQAGSKHRFVYYPLQANITGTMPNATTTVDQQYDVALHYRFDDNVLEILSVTGVSAGEPDESGKVVVSIE